jgi:hypothetical protein
MNQIHKIEVMNVMWSNIYWYFKLQKDKLSYQPLDIGTVTNLLLKTGCLEQVSQQKFKNKSPFPWMELILANSNDGNFATPTEAINHITLISIVCSRKNTKICC